MTGDRLKYLFQKRDTTERLVHNIHQSRRGSRHEVFAKNLREIDAEISQILGA